MFVLLSSGPYLIAQSLGFHIQEGTALAGKQHLHITTADTIQHTTEASSKKINLTGQLYVVEGTSLSFENTKNTDIVYIKSVVDGTKKQATHTSTSKNEKIESGEKEISKAPRFITKANIQTPYSGSSPYGFSFLGQSYTKGIIISNFKQIPTQHYSPRLEKSASLIVHIIKGKVSQSFINTFIPQTQDIRFCNRPPPAV